MTTQVNKPLSCNKSLDVILLLDGSGSMGEKGWAAEKVAANYLSTLFPKVRTPTLQ